MAPAVPVVVVVFFMSQCFFSPRMAMMLRFSHDIPKTTLLRNFPQSPLSSSQSNHVPKILFFYDCRILPAMPVSSGVGGAVTAASTARFASVP
jgi:hypothetical protein